MSGPLNFYIFIDIFFGIQKFNICNFAVDIRYNLVERLWKTLNPGKFKIMILTEKHVLNIIY